MSDTPEFHPICPIMSTADAIVWCDGSCKMMNDVEECKIGLIAEELAHSGVMLRRIAEALETWLRR